jgi:RNA polymerase sigma-70 factor (ECF subfamily)
MAAALYGRDFARRVMTVTEAELVRLCARGDWIAREALYRRYAGRILAILSRMARNEQDALDLLQETFLKAYRNIGRFEEHASLDTWLHRIAVNEALQWMRRRGREERGRRGMAAQSRGHDTLADASHDLRMDVESALERLPETDRAILVLRYEQGLDYAAIASVMDVAPGTVASRLNRARARLRETLASVWPIAEDTRAIKHPS